MVDKRKDYQVVDVICGGLAGLVSRVVISPLDVIKIRLQVQESVLNEPLKYRGMVGTFRTILKEEGLKGFWKGNWSAEYLYVSYGAIQFYTFNQLDKILRPRSSPELAAFLGGAGAGGLATLITYPFDLLRTRFAVQQDQHKKPYSSIKDAFSTIYKTEGVIGYYKGLGPTLSQILPYMGIMFLSYRFTKDLLITKAPIQISNYNDTIAGSFAGLVSKTAVFPLDVLRKRMQTIEGEKITSFKLFTRILKREGLLALYRGLLPGLFKAVPASAATFTVYGFCINCLNQQTA